MPGVEFITPDPAEEPDGVGESAGHDPRPPGGRRDGGLGSPRRRAAVAAGVLVALLLVGAIVRAATNGQSHATADASSSVLPSGSARPRPSNAQSPLPEPGVSVVCHQRIFCDTLTVLPAGTLAALRDALPGVRVTTTRSVVVFDDVHNPYLLSRTVAGTITTADGTVSLSVTIGLPSQSDVSGVIYDGDAQFGRFSYSRQADGFAITIAVTGPGKALPNIPTVTRLAGDPELLALA